MPTRISKSCSRPNYDHRYFETLYQNNADPWQVRSSDYEREKFAATLNVLQRARYCNALELGCSIGGLTRPLAARCGRLTSVDTSGTALNHARAYCKAPQVRFLQAHLPGGDWQDNYDLIVLSEILYYFTSLELAELAERLRSCIAAGKTELVAVHWTGRTDYPLCGDQASEQFRLLMRATCRQSIRHEKYRLENWTVQ